MKIKALAILACATSLFAQVQGGPRPDLAPISEQEKEQRAAAAASSSSCRAFFETLKSSYPRDVLANRIYAMVYARVTSLENASEAERNSPIYGAESKNCNLAVELLKTQLSNAALRKKLDSLNQMNSAVQRQISDVKDSLIDLWTSDAKGAKSLNAALNDERSRLERQSKENAARDSIEKARLANELAQKQKSIEEQQRILAQKDSLIAAQRAEAEKKLEALRSKTISVYKDARGTILSMSDILFETGKADLKSELKENLAEIAGILKNLLTDSQIVIEGHTDDVGRAELNQFLSEQRAEAVLKYMVERGVDASRLKSLGYGKSRPVADNKTNEGRAKNRRVELVIKDN